MLAPFPGSHTSANGRDDVYILHVHTYTVFSPELCNRPYREDCTNYITVMSSLSRPEYHHIAAPVWCYNNYPHVITIPSLESEGRYRG